MKKALFAFLLVCACADPERPALAPRDVILLTIDTWRADAAGFAGNANVRTLSSSGDAQWPWTGVNTTRSSTLL